jgi:hypothetical protein
MKLELKPDLEERAAAHAEAAGQTVAEFLERLVEQNLPEEGDVPRAPGREEAKRSFTPTQLSFSLWLRGFVNAALSINIILSCASFVGVAAAVLFRGQMTGPFQANLLTLSFAVATFSPISTGAVALAAGLRYLFTRFSIIITLGALTGFVAYMHYAIKFISYVEEQDWKSQAGIVAAIGLTFITALIAVIGLKLNDAEKNKEKRPRHRLTLRDFLSWRWSANLYEDVKEVYAASKALERDLKASPGVPRHSAPADIAGDFKAWNDATKLLITIATGLTVVSALFSNGDDILERAIRIIALLFLLVPALSCAYMEAFRRQCERQWQVLGMNRDGEEARSGV